MDASLVTTVSIDLCYRKRILPIGKEDHLRGVIDVVNQKAIVYDDSDESGMKYEVTAIPAELQERAERAGDRWVGLARPDQRRQHDEHAVAEGEVDDVIQEVHTDISIRGDPPM